MYNCCAQLCPPFVCLSGMEGLHQHYAIFPFNWQARCIHFKSEPCNGRALHIVPSSLHAAPARLPNHTSQLTFWRPNIRCSFVLNKALKRTQIFSQHHKHFDMKDIVALCQAGTAEISLKRIGIQGCRKAFGCACLRFKVSAIRCL